MATRGFFRLIKTTCNATDDIFHETIQQQLQRIRSHFSATKLTRKKLRGSLMKLTYAYLVGCDIQVGLTQAISLLVSDDFRDKSLAYFCISVFLPHNLDYLPLIINTVTKDLCSEDTRRKLLALHFFSSYPSVEGWDIYGDQVCKIYSSRRYAISVRCKCAAVIVRHMALDGILEGDLHEGKWEGIEESISEFKEVPVTSVKLLSSEEPCSPGSSSSRITSTLPSSTSIISISPSDDDNGSKDPDQSKDKSESKEEWEDELIPTTPHPSFSDLWEKKTVQKDSPPKESLLPPDSPDISTEPDPESSSPLSIKPFLFPPSISESKEEWEDELIPTTPHPSFSDLWEKKTVQKDSPPKESLLPPDSPDISTEPDPESSSPLSIKPFLFPPSIVHCAVDILCIGSRCLLQSRQCPFSLIHASIVIVYKSSFVHKNNHRLFNAAANCLELLTFYSNHCNAKICSIGNGQYANQTRATIERNWNPFYDPPAYGATAAPFSAYLLLRAVGNVLDAIDITSDSRISEEDRESFYKAIRKYLHKKHLVAHLKRSPRVKQSNIKALLLIEIGKIIFRIPKLRNEKTTIQAVVRGTFNLIDNPKCNRGIYMGLRALGEYCKMINSHQITTHEEIASSILTTIRDRMDLVKQYCYSIDPVLRVAAVRCLRYACSSSDGVSSILPILDSISITKNSHENQLFHHAYAFFDHVFQSNDVKKGVSLLLLCVRSYAHFDWRMIALEIESILEYLPVKDVVTILETSVVLLNDLFKISMVREDHDGCEEEEEEEESEKDDSDLKREVLSIEELELDAFSIEFLPSKKKEKKEEDEDIFTSVEKQPEKEKDCHSSASKGEKKFIPTSVDRVLSQKVVYSVYHDNPHPIAMLVLGVKGSEQYAVGEILSPSIKTSLSRANDVPHSTHSVKVVLHVLGSCICVLGKKRVALEKEFSQSDSSGDPRVDDLFSILGFSDGKRDMSESFPFLQSLSRKIISVLAEAVKPWQQTLAPSSTVDDETQCLAISSLSKCLSLSLPFKEDDDLVKRLKKVMNQVILCGNYESSQRMSEIYATFTSHTHLLKEFRKASSRKKK
ncbi:hypothetical protein ADUPG1_009811 [Aduncisulcus paluster]|uniref:Clathrin/coatomer adaptor adaptin-like N-terminal domain-containing protein n=1 Tax=Aduncisulcus paluster TaxID=2918883 RepID=A0ABQ5KY15_9EUKA|nr:hypothetical protein ADUPG1_009811 [Aduncisulcus paluster]